MVMMRRQWRRKDGSLYDPPKLVKFEWRKMRRDGYHRSRWEQIHEGSPF